ncbi:MAG: insulinase family protein [Candidatus Sabulitectum sp.]|nr:insulinase family protein [Candidatus Sabulitectum sp.]
MNQESSFKIVQSEFIPSVRSTVTRAIHTENGAELIHVHCEEERENFFTACFKSPPSDDTGVPHIIEHTVLNGSDKYPVKDPFMEMVKSSMATFINAMTYGDRTLYPCGSLNEKDFRNLVSIYMDAIFHPLLKEEFFLQEGYRLDFEEPGNIESPLVHNGVVYNEMKGAYSDPDSYMERELARFLYPDASCGKDSGGDPLAIPSLTYKQFMKFHTDHYHPSNCCLFTLTKIPFPEMAKFLEETLSGFKASGVSIEMVEQPRLKEPQRKDAPVPGGAENNCTVTSAWMVNDAGNPVETLAFSLLEDVLLDDDSSPVKAVLLNSELGTGLSGCGYDSDPEQRNFVIGLKGVERKDADTVFGLIQTSLKSLVDNGLNSDLVKNMLHRKELHLRAIGSNWPYSVMSSVCAAWTHGEDILQSLDLNFLLKSLKESMSRNPRFLEDMINRHLLKNTHRIDCVFYPDEKHFQEEDETIAADLQTRKEAMSPADLEKLAIRSEELARSMETPSTKEALATLPKLSISDVSTDPPSIFHKDRIVNGKLFLPTQIQTAGVCYVDLCFDMSELPVDLISHLPFFTSFLTRTGAAGMDYLEMAEAELACSGGLGTSVTSISSTATSINEFRIILKTGSQCLEEDLSGMLEVMKRRLFSPELDNTERIIIVAGELAEHARSSLIPGGQVFASIKAQAGLSAATYANNLLHGIPVLQQVAAISEETVEKEISAMKAIHKHLTEKASQILAWCGPADRENTVSNWLDRLPGSRQGIKIHRPPVFTTVPDTTGVVIKGGTSFAAMALPGIPSNHPLSGSGTVMMRMLSEGFLWDEIRVKKGAYGAGANLGGTAITFYSYRDPSPSSSLQTFQNAILKGIEEVDLSPRAVEDSIIASVKGMDPAIRPSMANGLAILRKLKGISINLIVEHRAHLLAVSADSIREFADILKSRSSEIRVCVVGNKDVLNSLNIDNRTEL